MKKFTNHSPGLRGITVEVSAGVTEVVWIEPGKTVEIDAKTIVGKLPDLGKPGASNAAPADDDAIEAARTEVANKAREVIETMQADHIKALRAEADRADLAEEALATANDNLTKVNSELSDTKEALAAATDEADKLRAEIAKFDKDGDGKPGGSKSKTT